MKNKWVLLVLGLIMAASAGYFVQRKHTIQIDSWHYQLQGYGPEDSFIEKHASDKNRLFVMDYSRDGSEDQKWSSSEIGRLKNSGSNLVLSYLSIGEAEEVRWYFRGMPNDLLGSSNPDWQDNYRVQYWDPRWHEIIATGKESSLARIIEAGFDGVYLDIVDAYESYPKRKTAAEEMIKWVSVIHQSARKKNSSFMIIPQNAPCIWKREHFSGYSDQDYQAIAELYWSSIDGVALEDTFFYGQKKLNNAYLPQAEVLDCLSEFRKRGKFILGVEYLNESSKIEKAHFEFKKHHILGLVTDRLLKGEFFYYRP